MKNYRISIKAPQIDSSVRLTSNKHVIWNGRPMIYKIEGDTEVHLKSIEGHWNAEKCVKDGKEVDFEEAVKAL